MVRVSGIEEREKDRQAQEAESQQRGKEHALPARSSSSAGRTPYRAGRRFICHPRLRFHVLGIRLAYLPGPRVVLFSGLFFIPFKSMAKGWRAWMQTLLFALTYFLIQSLLNTLLLIFIGNGHIRVNLRCCGILHRMGHWLETLQQWMPLKIIIEQHTAQIRMANITNTKHIIGLTFKPVRRWPDRNHAIYLRHLRVQTHLELQQLATGQRTQVIDTLQVVKHIGSGNTTEQIKSQLIP